MRHMLLYICAGAALLLAMPASAQDAPTQAEQSQPEPAQAAPTQAEQSQPEPAQEAPTQAKESPPPRRTDIQTRRRDKGVPLDDWPGSLPIPGLDTRFKIGGFVEVDAIHDSGPMASQGQFIPSSIATGNATGGQSKVSINPSRLYLETRTPLDARRLTTQVAVDLYRDGMGVDPRVRLRSVYVELTDILLGGDVFVGQDWSTFSDLEAFPNTLDFQGPNSVLGAIQPLVRWTRKVDDDLKVMIAAETPENHIIEGAGSLTGWPDGVLSVVWDRTPVQLMGSFLARDLGASTLNGPTRTLGWGVSLSGKATLGVAEIPDFVTFSASYGKGIGSDFNDQPPDAVLVGNGSLQAIPAFGWFVGYEHSWDDQFTSTVTYGRLEVDNLAAQSPGSVDRTRYASANLVWAPDEHWVLGIEELWGQRVDFNGAEGSNFRTQFTTRFSF